MAAIGTVYSWGSKKRFLERIKSFHPDIVHVFNFFPLLSPSIHYACWDAGVPVIQKISNFRLICPGGLLLRETRACHDCVGKVIAWPGLRHACYRESRTASAVVVAMLAAHRLMKTWERVVDAFIARTNFSRGKLIEGGIPANRIAIVPSFAPDPGTPGDGSGRYILFAGRLAPEKGVTTLLAAWERLKNLNVTLKIAGDGPLREAVARGADKGRFEYLGVLSRQEIQSLLLRASALVYPSDCYENFPLSIVEAFACGVPVIASGIGAMAEIIEHGRTGLHFQAGNSEALADAIQWAATHPGETTRMGREARAEYLQKYTPERNYQLLIDLYRRAISGRHDGTLAGASSI
jgi:glycosyltransferase involved in cell wall biosynthesis